MSLKKRTLKSLSYAAASLRIVLVAWIICGLVATGSLIWINNSLAIIPVDDPESLVQLEYLLGFGVELEHKLHAPGETPDPLKGAHLLRGNGGHDDDREKPFRLVFITGPMVNTEYKPDVRGFSPRRTVKAYHDFGHLKVMPNYIKSPDSLSLFTSKVFPRFNVDGLFYCLLYLNNIIKSARVGNVFSLYDKDGAKCFVEYLISNYLKFLLLLA